MPVLRRARPALWIATALCIAPPASASGAVTIGSDLEADATIGISCGAFCTLAHSALPATSTASGGLLAPTDGVVVRWRIKVGSFADAPVGLRILRQGSKPFDDRTGAGTWPVVTPATGQTSTYHVRLPIKAGDSIGINCCANTLSAFSATGAAWTGEWLPALLDGETPRAPTGSFSLELLINADVEPDADGDGFGDETQDQCPDDPLRQDDCAADTDPPDTDPPETEITEAPSNKSAKPKAKYKFSSSEPDSAFECKLKGKGLKKSAKRFNDCDSPRKYKRLDEGKFKFQVRAIDETGNVDPTPAKDKFKVVT